MNKITLLNNRIKLINPRSYKMGDIFISETFDGSLIINIKLYNSRFSDRHFLRREIEILTKILGFEICRIMVHT